MVGDGHLPTLAFHASYALQGLRPMKVSQLRTVTKELRTAISSAPATLKYLLLEPASIHIRLFSDAALKHLDKKGSQLGVLVALCDRYNTFFGYLVEQAGLLLIRTKLNSWLWSRLSNVLNTTSKSDSSLSVALFPQFTTKIIKLAG